jgi:porin
MCLRERSDFQSVYGPALPLRSSEILFTAVYPYEVQEGLTLQPNLQYVRHPGGGATGPLVPRRGERVPDATVVGLRAILKF